MRVSLSWLKQLVRVDDSVEVLADRLSMAGFEVEDIEDLSARAQGVVVGFVLERKKHPDADKLSVCSVDVGGDAPLQIVCGASNVRAGLHVPVATVGAVLPAVELTIKAGEIRGVSSQGMICSLTELGLAEASDGIAELNSISDAMPANGTPVAELLGLDDTILDLAITANRPDGLSMVGIAREVAALTAAELALPELTFSPSHSTLNCNDASATAMRAGGLYGVTLIEGVDGAQTSPDWMKQRLDRAGIKSVNAVVDITNLVMLEQGQPLHAFDADALERFCGQPVDASSFGLRQARAGEVFVGLDDRELTLDERSQVVTCHDQVIALAGVMGSRASGVSETTKRIWLESAMFSPVHVRSTARAVGVRTDASSRYEKGLPVQITLACSARAVDLIQQMFEVNVIGRWVCGNVSVEPKPVLLRRRALHQLLGPINSASGPVALQDAVVEQSLSALGCELERCDDGWQVHTPPSRQQDLQREVDLIEEVARLTGFDRFTADLPDPLSPGALTPRQQAERRLRRLFCSAGLQEVTTLSLVGASEQEPGRIAISNPLLAETSHLRTNLWEEHLQICVRNLQASQAGCWLFEMGKIYSGTDQDVEQQSVLAGVICAERRLEHWTTNGKTRIPSYHDARGRLTMVMNAMQLELSDRVLDTDERLHPGRAATLILEGKPLGCFGQLHPAIAEQLELPDATYLFELKLEQLLAAATRANRWVPTFKVFPTVPASERDLSVVVDSHCAASDLIQTIRKAGKPLLEHVELIDRFEGEQLGSGRASQTFRLRYRGKTTLKDDDVQPIHNKVRQALEKQFKAELRS
ncbi:MAG: phenylalanine--tRNA ligase subunit beta [Cyanobium sp. NAT70]|nr:phenylalanine--tRNA ligase subunit beta [Cyanobium sp. NAT70]|tara:strand:- start:1269 stop:3713 length:2445 start_codon:yes stop_codon:yes gene_type:complete